MAKGEYEFPILVTCLLILALQIHNPFQSSRQSDCRCDGEQTQGSRPSDGTQQQYQQAQQPAGAGLRAGGAQQQQLPPQDPPAAYRPSREIAPAVASPGLSTDALLRELDAIQGKAREQQDTLAAAGKMPPASPILQHLKEVEEGDANQVGARPMATPSRGMSNAGMAATTPPMAAASPGVYGGGGAGIGGGAMVAADTSAPMLRRREDLGRFLEARQPRGLGVVLGVGRGDFALRLLNDWASSQGVYLVDPFIHIWRGYNDPANVQDREHQMIFEDLRNRLQMFEGRYVLVRDFSHSFCETYRSGGTAPGLPTFIYIDANHAEQAVARDLELWWPLLASGGLLAGSTYMDDADGNIRVRSVVDKFIAKQRLQLYLTHDDVPPSWFVFKS